ncbi:aminotransferase class I/II-fold pyridoxal phosphate-dependent enzyme [Streptomyces cellulosae]
MHLGDPATHGLPTPPHILDAVKDALDRSRSYSSAQRLPDVPSAVATYYHHRGLPLNPSDIHLGNGVSEFVPLALQALLNPGDEVLVPAPGYPLWAAAIKLAGGLPVHYRCDEHSGWQPDPDHVRHQITPRTVALVTNTPHNPTGAVWTPATLRALTQIAPRHELLLMADEIYEHSILAALAPDLPCVTFSGLSKIACIPGFRTAWLAISGPRATTRAYAEAITQLSELAEPATSVEQFDCPTCEVPAGSTCRTRGGKVAPKYHTPASCSSPSSAPSLKSAPPPSAAPVMCGRGARPPMPPCPRPPRRPRGWGTRGAVPPSKNAKASSMPLKRRAVILSSRRSSAPGQGSARVRQGDGLRPHHQEGRPPPTGDLHRARDEASGPRRR